MDALERGFTVLSSNESTSDSFWGAFGSLHNLIDLEIRWLSGVSPLFRSTNPLHAMEGFKREYPQIYAMLTTESFCI